MGKRRVQWGAVALTSVVALGNQGCWVANVFRPSVHFNEQNFENQLLGAAQPGKLGRHQCGICNRADGTYRTCGIPAHLPKGSCTLPKPPAPGEHNSVSMLLWSCNEAFEFAPTENLSVPTRYALSLWTFAKRAQGKLRVKGLPERPTFGMAVGDQVYVDPRPLQHGKDYVGISPFGGDRSDKWRVDTDRFDRDRFFDILHHGYLNNPPMAAALKLMPTVMLLDDHELRDGWGSQGDEGEKVWRDWYLSGRRAYLNWQGMRNPYHGARSWKYLREHPRAAMDFTWEPSPGVHVFGMDTRTSGYINAGNSNHQLMGDQQFKRLQTWFKNGGKACSEKGDLWVLATQSPMSGTIRSVRKWIGSHIIKPELRDDYHDQWSNPRHEAGRELILVEMAARVKRCKEDRFLILSGDIHESAVYGLATQDHNIIGYEVVSSGIAADHEEGWVTIIGSKSWASKRTAIRSRLMSRIHNTPSFAELSFQKDNPAAGLFLTWYTFSDEHNVRNSELFCKTPNERSSGKPALASMRVLPARPKKSTPLLHRQLVTQRLTFLHRWHDAKRRVDGKHEYWDLSADTVTPMGPRERHLSREKSYVSDLQEASLRRRVCGQ